MTDDQWKTLKSLYDQARQVSADQRSVFLTRACGGDEQLRREVESLLKYGEVADVEAFLERTRSAVAGSGPLTGTSIAHYTVGERIGAGGMGEVYRAKDAKLGRDVALKVLPASFVQDPDRRSRFVREARVLAALNHPQIAAIYGFEEAGSECALVLELVEGPTLADRLSSGAIPVKDALHIARQLAEALQAAHEKDIVHRDLKPANVKITPRGVVKVLDFGLAKALAGENQVENLSQAQTATREGVILGTPAYMSPEQATGRTELDERADIWAFGCVLYEMLSGRRPFVADSVPDMLTAVMTREPDWSALPKATPSSVRSMLRRCLAKDPKQRLHHIADARIELDELLSTPSASTVRTRTVRTLGLIAGAAVILLLAALVGYQYMNTGPEAVDVVEIRITNKPIADPISYAAISPDGTLVVYNDSTAIHIQDIDSGEDSVITGTSNGVPAEFCFICARFSWSQDGKKILADGEVGAEHNIGVWEILWRSREVRLLVPESEQGSFSPDGSQIAYWHDGKYWLGDANGGNPREFMSFERLYRYRGLKWSPDGQSLVYLKSQLGSAESTIEAMKLDKSTPTELLRGVGLHDFWWTKDNRLIYTQTAASVDNYDLWDVRLDPRTGKPTETPRRLRSWPGYSPGSVSVSEDGKRIITTKGNSQSDVYVADLESSGRRLGTERGLTLDNTRFDWPTGWTKEGKILFSSDRNGPFKIFKQAESAKAPTAPINERGDTRAAQTSPDGKWLLYMVWPDPSRAEPVQIMRARESGGVAAPVLKASGPFASGVTFSAGGEPDLKGPRIFPDFRCSSSGPATCLLAEAGQEEVLFSFFDPMQGRVGEATRVSASPAKFFWDFSPDGKHVAYGEFNSRASDQLTVLQLHDKTSRNVPLPAQWTTLSSLSWTADGRSLFVTTSRREGSDLLHVTLEGEVEPLRQETSRWIANPRPSPDGKRLAYAVRTTDSNVWLIETK